MYKAEVLAHSVAVETGIEAFTFRVTMPRIILAEFNTHRQFAKNTSSSRAIPIKRMIKFVYDNMFTPVWWGANQSGMQANTELTGIRLWMAKKAWRLFGIGACATATIMNKIGLHKQLTNRLIENFSYVTVIFTTTDLYNFLHLRNHKDAQPEIRVIARMIEVAAEESLPTKLKVGEWHLPLITADERKEFTLEDCKLISAARCASTSYTTVTGEPISPKVAQNIVDKLIGSTPIHASPFEHQLTPDTLVDIEYRAAGTKKKLQVVSVWKNPHMHGNTLGFIQQRKQLSNESVIDTRTLIGRFIP